MDRNHIFIFLQITKEELFADVARDILLYVSRDLTDEVHTYRVHGGDGLQLSDCTALPLQDGGFYSGEDADSLPLSSSEHKREGAFCVWTEKEITSLLSSPLPSPSSPPAPPSPSLTLAHLFCHHYGVKPNGNVSSDKVKFFMTVKIFIYW